MWRSRQEWMWSCIWSISYIELRMWNHNCEDHSLLDFASAVQYINVFLFRRPRGIWKTNLTVGWWQFERSNLQKFKCLSGPGGGEVKVSSWSAYYLKITVSSLKLCSPLFRGGRNAECGVIEPVGPSRIVSASKATKGEWPWQAIVAYKRGG